MCELTVLIVVLCKRAMPKRVLCTGLFQWLQVSFNVCRSLSMSLSLKSLSMIVNKTRFSSMRHSLKETYQWSPWIQVRFSPTNREIKQIQVVAPLEFSPSQESPVNMWCRYIGLFCRHIGLFCRYTGLFCRHTGLFSAGAMRLSRIDSELIIYFFKSRHVVMRGSNFILLFFFGGEIPT